MFLLNRLRSMVMDNPPLTVFVFEDGRPSEITHLDFAGFCRHLVLERSRNPNQVSMGMNVNIVVERELRALVTGGQRLHTLCIFIPAVVLQRCDIEKRMRSRRVVLRNIGGIERRPAVPYLLQISFVGSKANGLLHRRLPRLRSGRHGQAEQAKRNRENALHAWVFLTMIRAEISHSGIEK